MGPTMGKGGKTELRPEDGAADRFRAVVKRLLDTPPMHKAAKPKPKRKKARKE
jgi:hypothetical protein